MSFEYLEECSTMPRLTFGSMSWDSTKLHCFMLF